MTSLFPQTSADTKVALLPCNDYQRQKLKGIIERSVSVLQIEQFKNSDVLVKPNLISAGTTDDLACTHPEFTAACVEWLVDNGARVTVGDSPAFGSGLSVMKKIGLMAALKGLPVKFARFDKGKKIRLRGGVRVVIATEILDSDFLVNLPRLKAHSQVYMTMGVKNLFGTVIGIRKPWLHMRYGRDHHFVQMLTDIMYEVPGGITICDGIIAMQHDGPLHGNPVNTGIVATSRNPVALDTALLILLGLEAAKSPIWHYAFRKHIGGSDPDSLIFPLRSPDDFPPISFHAPSKLKPIVFQPHRAVGSIIRRFFCRS